MNTTTTERDTRTDLIELDAARLRELEARCDALEKLAALPTSHLVALAQETEWMVGHAGWAAVMTVSLDGATTLDEAERACGRFFFHGIQGDDTLNLSRGEEPWSAGETTVWPEA